MGLFFFFFNSNFRQNVGDQSTSYGTESGVMVLYSLPPIIPSAQHHNPPYFYSLVSIEELSDKGKHSIFQHLDGFGGIGCLLGASHID